MAVSRPPTLTVYDATKFVKQSQAARLQSDSTANRNINSNSIKNSVRKSNESVTSQENSSPFSSSPFSTSSSSIGGSSIENGRFTNTRNRFHSVSTAKPLATSSRSTPLLTPPTPAKVTVTNDPSSSSSSSSATDQRQPNRIPISSRFGTSREQNTSVRINKFLRQPLYTSRENQQQAIKKINVTHNGSGNHDGGASASQEVC